MHPNAPDFIQYFTLSMQRQTIILVKEKEPVLRILMI
jgi:hypothetical protein